MRRGINEGDRLTPREPRILDGPLSGSGHEAAVTVRWDEDGLHARRIRLRLDAMPEYRRMIAHELLHRHVEETWGLPLVLEDGLAELISSRNAADGAGLHAMRRQDGLEALQSDAPVLRCSNGLSKATVRPGAS